MVHVLYWQGARDIDDMNVRRRQNTNSFRHLVTWAEQGSSEGSSVRDCGDDEELGLGSRRADLWPDLNIGSQQCFHNYWSVGCEGPRDVHITVKWGSQVWWPCQNNDTRRPPYTRANAILRSLRLSKLSKAWPGASGVWIIFNTREIIFFNFWEFLEPPYVTSKMIPKN